MIRWLEHTPASDVTRRKKGHWQDRCPGAWVDHYATCSECGERMALDELDNYCPSCGADMRTNQDVEEA